MHCNHGRLVGSGHLIQGNPQASRYALQGHALIEVAGENELLQRREGLHRVHRQGQHAGQLGLVLDVLRISVIMAGSHTARGHSGTRGPAMVTAGSRLRLPAASRDAVTSADLDHASYRSGRPHDASHRGPVTGAGHREATSPALVGPLPAGLSY
jgi:hypothetical protein